MFISHDTGPTACSELSAQPVHCSLLAVLSLPLHFGHAVARWRLKMQEDKSVRLDLGSKRQTQEKGLQGGLVLHLLLLLTSAAALSCSMGCPTSFGRPSPLWGYDKHGTSWRQKVLLPWCFGTEGERALHYHGTFLSAQKQLAGCHWKAAIFVS